MHLYAFKWCLFLAEAFTSNLCNGINSFPGRMTDGGSKDELTRQQNISHDIQTWTLDLIFIPESNF